VFAVAWGERAVELLSEAATRAGTTAVERIGALAVMDCAGAGAGDWRCWISGRLTNERELRERFGLPEGTEPAALIARAYTQLGASACEQLRGTFVLVALDRARERATVIRDQLGGRPLVYTRVGGGALLAEHERALVELLPGTPSPDRLALAQWIERGTTPAERTMFEGIRRIPPAHRALLDAGEVTIEPYWRPRYTGVASGSREEIAERLRSAAFAAVTRAAQGATRPAVRLSGGLDSACVAAGLAAQGTIDDAVALSAVFPTHAETDERELIEATARHTGLALELIAFDDRASILAPALEHIERWSLPPVTPNLFVWKPVMADARRLGVDVMLDGEGGDELFGFAPYLIADRLRRGRLLAAWRLTRRIPEVGAEADAHMRLRALRVYGTSRLVPPAVKRRRRGRMAASPAGALLLADDAAALQELEDARDGDTLDGPLWWRGLAEGLTMGRDRLGVAAHLRRESVDERIDRHHPFLFDLELLDTVLSDPPELQFDPLRDRALLRDGLAGYIPEAVRTRHAKSFFTGLLGAGLATDGALLAEGPAREDAPVRAFVRADALQELLRGGVDPHDGRAAQRLWHVGLADAWLRALERPEYPRELLERALSRA
jgi:asparagine synthase (glutamine-hydrolysing)